MSHPTLSFPLLTAIRYVAAQLSCHTACVTFNATLLQRLGVSQGELDEMARGGSGALEGREAALLQLVRQALSEPATVSAEHVESLRRLGWMDGDILDAVMHGAALMGSSLVHRAFAR
jgi:alkylhydroperoxidase family enzyme